ncbi:MAG: hypothetical protein PWQ55_115 [Chloroflexota bacterium]|nr:hypothetical protein [Chloroflexota bacterium]
MGNYANSWVDSLYLGSSKNDIDPFIMRLFSTSDKNVVTNPKNDLPKILTDQWLHELGENEQFQIICYKTDLNIVKDRLNLLGYTYDAVIDMFYLAKEKEIEHFEDLSKRNYIWKETVEEIKLLTVENWIEDIRKFNECFEEKKTGKIEESKKPSMIDMIINDNWHGFPGPDKTAALRLAIEALTEAKFFIYDVTDLILPGYYEIEDDFVKIANDFFNIDYFSNGKIIIITEGRTDSDFLSRTLKLLYPHLYNYFTFMDFNSSNVGGGVGTLANIIKAFSGTGIFNKIIAVFDNDTAAQTAINGLKSTHIPRNIKILQLPYYSFLTKYPTIGPSGKVIMDINSIASSIELYLGREILLDKNNDYQLIQWTGYDQGVGRYQGEILNKDFIQRKFLEKLKICENDNSKIREYDWEGLHLIFNSIFSIFNSCDKEDLLNELGNYNL